MREFDPCSVVFKETRPIRRARLEALARALRQNRDGPIKAIDLAATCQVTGNSHEAKRRRVRELVKQLREQDGYEICGDDHATEGGYWLARNAEEWQRFQQARRTKARFAFANAKRCQDAVIDRKNKQGTLFDVNSPTEWARR